MANDTLIKGIPVIAVESGSPSEKAGIKVGDIIVAVDSVAVQNLQDYIVQAGHRKGDMVVDIMRGNTFLTIVVPPNPDFI